MSKEYHNAYNRSWYKDNAAKRRIQISERRNSIKAWLNRYKANCECIKCGENHPATLDFHHKDPSEKNHEIANAVRDGWSIERIEREIAKCEILCSNCHRKEHFLVV